MADAGYRFQQAGSGGGSFYYQQQQQQQQQHSQHNQHNQHNQHHRHINRNGSPVNNGRGVYNNDTPSPSRSPVSQSSSHHPYGLLGQNQAQAQGMMINGGSHQRFMQMGMNQKYQHQHHPQQNHSHHQQTNTTGGHGVIGHQHSFSSGTLSNATPHFTPSTLQNGNASNSQGHMNDNFPAHWQLQVQLIADSRQAHASPHHHCKKDGHVTLKKSAEQALSDESTEDNLEERNRVTNFTPRRRQDWDSLDFSGQGMRNLSNRLFGGYPFLRRLYLDHNNLHYLDPRIGKLRCLEHLDISSNQIMVIPEEIGMLVNLKMLLAYDNQLQGLPREIGHLYKLEVLGIEGNPIDEDLRDHVAAQGSKALITQIREGTSGKLLLLSRQILR